MNQISFALRASASQAVGPWALALAALMTMNCNARISPGSDIDSQSHWLKACQSTADCGELNCLCGVCTTVCSSNAECNQGPGMTASCNMIDPSSDDQCAGLASNEQICVADCPGGDCANVVLHSTSSTPPAQSKPVPRCPDVAQRTAPPSIAFNTTVTSYDGTATINQFTQSNIGGAAHDDTVVLVPNDVVDQHFDIRFNMAIPSSFVLGRRVAVSARHGGDGSAAYDLIVVRDEAGKVMLAYHSGGDQLFQDGMFATPDMFGATLSLAMLCQSPVDGGCFEHQVQAEYAGTFQSDNQLTLAGWNSGELDMAGAPYKLTFASSSVDGGALIPPCSSEIKPARYIEFALLAQ